MGSSDILERNTSQNLCEQNCLFTKHVKQTQVQIDPVLKFGFRVTIANISPSRPNCPNLTISANLVFVFAAILFVGNTVILILFSFYIETLNTTDRNNVYPNKAMLLLF